MLEQFANGYQTPSYTVVFYPSYFDNSPYFRVISDPPFFGTIAGMKGTYIGDWNSQEKKILKWSCSKSISFLQTWHFVRSLKAANKYNSTKMSVDRQRNMGNTCYSPCLKSPLPISQIPHFKAIFLIPSNEANTRKAISHLNKGWEGV